MNVPTRTETDNPSVFGSGPWREQGRAAKSARKGVDPIRVLVADDHPLVRRGISACLAKHAQVQIVGEAADGQEAVRKIMALQPNVVLMDIDMPQLNGIAAMELLRKDAPQIKVLVLSMHTQTEHVLRILQSGAAGYVLKGAPTEDLINAIESVNRGEPYFSPEVARLALSQFVRGSGGGASPTQLTRREKEVLTQIAEGLSNKEVASMLGVGVRTVETHRERIMRKLNIHSVAGLTRFAIAKGFVSIGDGFRA